MSAIDFAALLAEELAGGGGAKDSTAAAGASAEADVAAAADASCAESSGRARGVDSEALAAAACCRLELPAGWRTEAKVDVGAEGVWVVRDAVSEAAAEELRRMVRHPAGEAAWVNLKGRRVQEWDARGGTPLPPYLRELAASLEAEGLWGGRGCNHVLVNDYDVQGGIMPHTDGPAYVPETVTLSLEEPALFRFAPRGLREAGGERVGEGALTLLLLPRDMVVFRGPLYTNYTHAILPGAAFEVPAGCPNAEPGAQFERSGRRVSLTFRHMLQSPTAE